MLIWSVGVQQMYSFSIHSTYLLCLIFMLPYPRRKEKGKAATPRDNSECTHSDCDRAGGADRPCNVEAFSDKGEMGWISGFQRLQIPQNFVWRSTCKHTWCVFSAIDLEIFKKWTNNRLNASNEICKLEGRTPMNTPKHAFGEMPLATLSLTNLFFLHLARYLLPWRRWRTRNPGQKRLALRQSWVFSKDLGTPRLSLDMYNIMHDLF